MNGLSNIVGKIARILTTVYCGFLILLEIIFVIAVATGSGQVPTFFIILNLIISAGFALTFYYVIKLLIKNDKKFFKVLAATASLLFIYGLLYRLIFITGFKFELTDLYNFVLYAIPVLLAAVSYFFEKSPIPSDLTTPRPNEVFTPLQYQGILVRGSAYIIDQFIVAVPIFVILYMLGLIDKSENYLIAISVVFLIYKAAMEAVYGKTLGKMISKIEVRKVDGARCSPAAAILRNLALILDFFFGFLIAIIVMTVTKKRQRVGDLIANTVVIKP